MKRLLLSIALIAFAYGLSVNLVFTNPLGVLAENEAYQGWLDVGSNVTTGQLNYTADTPMEITYDIGLDGLNMIPEDTPFFITIEAKDPVAMSPGPTRIVSGVFNNQMATLSADSIWGANPFANTAGSFFLATPTSANDTDECNGIWFFDGENGNPSLVLPQPPAGWVYEGWVVDMSDPQNPMPMSTGTFTSASGPDSDGAGPYAGSDNPAPMFPGQDYVVIMPKNLCNNYTAVISIEPNPDRNPDIPFFLKPLAAAIMPITGTGNPQNMAASKDILPIIQVVVPDSPTSGGPITTPPTQMMITNVPTVAPTTKAPPSGSLSNTIVSISLLLCSLLVLM